MPIELPCLRSPPADRALRPTCAAPGNHRFVLTIFTCFDIVLIKFSYIKFLHNNHFNINDNLRYSNHAQVTANAMLIHNRYKIISM